MANPKWKISLVPAAVRQLEKLDAPARRRVDASIDDLATEPRPRGAKPLKGMKGVWRKRVGDYRVVYKIEDDRLVVLVVKIGHRRDVYDR